jgi:parallel beta-helix repeat protein
MNARPLTRRLTLLCLPVVLLAGLATFAGLAKAATPSPPHAHGAPPGPPPYAPAPARSLDPAAEPPGGGGLPGGNQWIAKQYSEVFGRTPTASEWMNAVSQVAGGNCGQQNLTNYGVPLFNSAEYASLAYSNAAKVITLYRAILNRDPDSAGFNSTLARLNSGASAGTVAGELYASAEFGNLVSRICSDFPYYWGGSNTTQYPRNTTGHFGGGSAAQLQAALNATPTGGTLYLDQGAVVTAETTVTVPANVTLATYALGSRNQYALMGRIIRTGPYVAPVVLLNAGSALTKVWVDGNRAGFDVSFPTLQPAQRDQIRDQTMNVRVEGNNGRVTDDRIVDPYGGSNLKVMDARAPATIQNNLITSYATSHYMDSITGAPLWADGITFAGSSGTISGNQIVDSTDVGIVLFPGTSNNVYSNTVLNLGNSSFGGYVFDPFAGTLTQPFTGSSIHDNTMWSSSSAHVHIGLAVGTKAWFGAQGALGSGAAMTNNVAPAGTVVRGGFGVAVDGMLNTTVSGNNLNAYVSSDWAQNNQSFPATCVFAAQLIAADTPNDASGTIQTPVGTVVREALHKTCGNAVVSTWEGYEIP